MTGACTGDHCKKLNPSGKSCKTDIKAMLPDSELELD